MSNIDEVIRQLKQERDRIDGALKALGQIGSASSDKRRGPRKMSAEARKRISDAQKARWRKVKRAA